MAELLTYGSHVFEVYVPHKNLALALFGHLHLKMQSVKKNYILFAFLLIKIN